jgi:hypothetical protein
MNLYGSKIGCKGTLFINIRKNYLENFFEDIDAVQRISLRIV